MTGSSAGITPIGTYRVTGSALGQQGSGELVVSQLPGGALRFSADKGGKTHSLEGRGRWNEDRTEVTVKLTYQRFGIADVKATITLKAVEDGWELVAEGSGSVMGKRSSGTATGFKRGGGLSSAS